MVQNCPVAEGGDLAGSPEDCAPDFAVMCEGKEIGVLARLVYNRFGLHVVQVCARQNPKPSLSRCMPPWPSSCATRPG